jgi:hypothetical protein
MLELAVWGWLVRMWRAMRSTTFLAFVVAVLLEALRRIGMTWLEELALNVAISVLARAAKNPKVSGVSDSILQHVRDDATVALDALNPSCPPPPGYTKAS